MVLFGLTVIVSRTQPNTAVSLLILSFLVPAVLFSARRRRLRRPRRSAARSHRHQRPPRAGHHRLVLVGDNFALLLLLNIFVSTVTVFFAPAEAAMIPKWCPRQQLLSANGIFTLTLNAAFAVGFALLGPLVINIAGPQAVIGVVAGLYFLAAVFCFTLPASPPPAQGRRRRECASARRNAPWGPPSPSCARGSASSALHRSIGWSLLYLGITASLIGVLGVLGPTSPRRRSACTPKDTAIIILPLGGGIVMGILLLNSYGKFLPRRRVIEGGLIVLGIMLGAAVDRGTRQPAAAAGRRASDLLDLSSLTSLLAVVVFIAFIAGIAYGASRSRRRRSSRRTCPRTCAAASSAS